MGDLKDPSPDDAQMPVEAWEHLSQGLDLGPVCCEDRRKCLNSDLLLKAVTAWLGGFPAWLHTLCAWDSAAVFFKCHSNESRKGKSRFTGNSSQMQRAAFPLNSVFWLSCCRMTQCLSLDQFVYHLLDYLVQ